jgi:hypothetical protein
LDGLALRINVAAMILTPIDHTHLPGLLDRFAAGLDDGPRAIFCRIAAAGAERASGARATAHHHQALALLARFGMALRPGSPHAGFSWDGSAVRTGTEAYVLLHEAAHFQVAAPGRRRRIDFGLGPGPETGERALAERAATLHGLACEREEAMASLLGILWEVELGHPGLASFLDQNWLEGAGRRGTAAHFTTILAALDAGGFVAADGRPTRCLRRTPDRVVSASRERAVRRSVVDMDGEAALIDGRLAPAEPAGEPGPTWFDASGTRG